MCSTSPRRSPLGTTDDGDGRLTFVRGVFAQSPGAYPTIGDSSTYANPYAAGSFLFRDFPWIQNPTTKEASVTIDGSGFDLSRGNDFATLPPSFVSGTVSTFGRTQGGTTSPNATPTPGVTVQLAG